MSEHFRKYVKKEHYPVHPSNIRFKTPFKNCILEALKRRTWKEVEHDSDWDIFWTEKEWIHEVMDHLHLAPHQRLNHFRNYYELCRKDNLIKNLKRHKKNLEKEGKLDEAAAYNFFPTTYTLPGEYSIFCEEFKKNSNHVWIMKPIGKAQGKGIFLFNKLSQVSQWKSDTRWKPDNPQVENYIVQRYINNPLLIGGKKFDMRIYCLVTSYSPLVAYLYRDGFARFTHHRYDNEDITNTYVHLTNVAIQKTSENYDEKLGGKWDLRTLKLYLMSQYGQDAVSEAFSNIQQVIIRALQSVQKVIMNDKHCFELYGFDILFDDQLKPWLLEVNGSPSMTANTAHDFELKCNLLDDVFTIIDMERILTGQEEQIGGFDLICKGTPIKNESSLFTTMLSCYNNRNQQLKKLAKMISSRLAQSYNQQEQEKNVAKDPSLASTTDTSVTGIKAKSKLPPKVGGIPPTANTTTTNMGAKITKVPPTLTKQNSITQPNVKETKELRETGTGNFTKFIATKARESNRGKNSIGLPPVNPNISGTALTSSTSAHAGSATPSNNSTNNLQRVPSQYSSALSPNMSTISSGGGRQQFNQPSQNQIEKTPPMNTTKTPSTLQLAGGSSIRFEVASSIESNNTRTKGKSVASMQDFLEQKQNIYSYNINDRPSSKLEEEKNDRYIFTRASEDLLSNNPNRGKDTPKRMINLKSDDSNLNEEEVTPSKKKEYYEELHENYNIINGQEYE